MIAPVVLLVAAFTLYPYIYALWSSVRVVSPLLPPAFAGLKNYESVITSIYFLRAVRNTLIFTAVSVPITVLLGLLTAALLNRRFFGDVALKALVLLPWAIPISISGVVWRGFFDDGWGALNALLYMAGIIPKYIGWLRTEGWLATLVVITVQIWTQFPFATVLILAAMQAISEELYEAAAIDGANRWSQFRHVTLPLLSPTIYFLTLWSTIGTFKAFNHIWVLRESAALGTTDTASVVIFQAFNRDTRFGYASALAILLLLIILILTAANNRIASRRVFYG